MRRKIKDKLIVPSVFILAVGSLIGSFYTNSCLDSNVFICLSIAGSIYIIREIRETEDSSIYE